MLACLLDCMNVLTCPGLHECLLQSNRNGRDNEMIKRAIGEYDEALEAYIPGELW